MQAHYNNGIKGPVEPFDDEKLKTHLANPNIEEVRIFRLKKGMKVQIVSTWYKVVSVRPNGKVSMRPCGKPKGFKDGHFPPEPIS